MKRPKYVMSQLPEGIRPRFKHFHTGNTPAEVMEMAGFSRVVRCELLDRNGKVLHHHTVALDRNHRRAVARQIALGKCFKAALTHNKLKEVNNGI